VRELFAFEGGAVRVPSAPGLGVTLDGDALNTMHERYVKCAIRNRDDTGYMRRVEPSYEWKQPRW
jgi:glucarate dehydratase